ncbi:hypothetical protein EVAR_52586_1 [Eumeta japonica]|uniref:Uncharacterized protein n=1 Tax=Eumeta variegata TaxID=151549 RepID=A0A4C1SMI3_EUMVA|nr:hypothetical protein EVAR_52586_1 [Eumeta japonica]
MLWLNWLKYENEPTRPVRYHTLIEYKHKVAAHAVAFSPAGNALVSPLEFCKCDNLPIEPAHFCVISRVPYLKRKKRNPIGSLCCPSVRPSVRLSRPFSQERVEYEAEIYINYSGLLSLEAVKNQTSKPTQSKIQPFMPQIFDKGIKTRVLPVNSES